MEKEIRNFIKKHGTEGIDPGSKDALAATITKVIGDMIQREYASGSTPADSAILVMPGVIVQLVFKVSHNVNYRVPAIRIFLTTDFADLLIGEGESYTFGEVPMMNLFKYILANEFETWIVDTDVLNWNMQMGTLRDPSGIVHRLNATVAHGTTILDNFGFENEMVAFMTIELADYMS